MPSVLWHCWLGGRKGIRPVKKLSFEVLAWLFVWSDVQICIWPSWCHCHSLSLASVKSRLVLPFWYWLTRVVPDNGPLNRCVCLMFAFSALTLLVGWQEGHPACKKTEWWGAGMVLCLERDLHMTQLMPLPLTVFCFSKIQFGFTFLVLAHPGSPGQWAVKRVCVCVCVCEYLRLIFFINVFSILLSQI